MSFRYNDFQTIIKLIINNNNDCTLAPADIFWKFEHIQHKSLVFILFGFNAYFPAKNQFSTSQLPNFPQGISQLLISKRVSKMTSMDAVLDPNKLIYDLLI